MLARLQQLMVLALVLQALLWSAAPWALGIRPALAWAGALLPCTIYAVALAVEFVVMREINARRDALSTPWSAVLRAWWGELRSGPLVFGWRQPFRSRRWPDRPDTGASGRRGVLLIHGFVCNRGIWNGWLQRLEASQVPCVAVNLEPVFGSIDDYLPQLETAIQRLHAATGLAPVVVAHSMGGLALRRWWSRPGNLHRLHHAITLGTPHRGTWLARFALSANGRQMREGSAWLQALAETERVTRRQRLTCYYSHCDNIVFPALNATLTGADNRHLTGTAHVHMVAREEPYEELLRRLAG